MASAYERLMNKVSGGSAYDTLVKRVAEQPKVTVDKAAYNTLTTPITKVYSDPITSMSKKYAADAYNKVAQNLADPVQAANLQFAVAGMPRPTQNDINNLYNKLNNLKAQQLNQSYGEAYTGEYDADIKETERQISELAKIVPNAQLRSKTAALDPIAKGLSSSMLSFATTALKSPLFLSAQVASAIKAATGVDVAEYALQGLKSDVAWADKNIQGTKESSGTGYDIYSTLAEGTAAALPQAALAIATGGVSAVEALPALGANAGLGTAITNGLSKMIQSPMFATSYAQTYGASYNQSIASGASEDEAQLTATLVGLINSAVELTGGLETLPTALKSGNVNAVKEWVTSALSEGKEEVIQGVIERLTQKAVYDKEKPFFPSNKGAAEAKELGTYGKGNIDLTNRPSFKNPDGSTSTVDSTSFNVDGKEVLIPTVWVENGKVVHGTPDEALEHYFVTGQYLGKFDTVHEADAYAQKLHTAQEYLYTIKPNNPNAVFNPNTALEEGGMGALISGILGGGQVMAQSAINNMPQKAQQPVINNTQNIQPAPQNTALNTNSNTTPTPNVESGTSSLPSVESKVATASPAYTYNYQPDVQSINNKTWYHGTGTQNLVADKLTATATKIEGLLGAGVYLTDSQEIAQGYANGRGKKTGTPTVYEANVNLDSVLDMSKPMPDNIYKYFDTIASNYANEYGYVDEYNDFINAQSSGQNGVDVFRKFSELLTSVSKGESISLSEFYDDFDYISSGLVDNGYEAYTHEGGKLIGNKQHQVLVLIDPKGELGGRNNYIAKFQPAIQPATPDGMGAMSSSFPYVETQSQTKAADGITTHADKETLGQATHKLLTNVESRAQANERLQFDYDGEKAELANSEWGAAETVMGYQYLADALDEAHRTGDYTEAIRMKKMFDEKGTIEGQALQARKQFVTTPEYFIAEAAETLDGDNIRKLSPQKKVGIMETVKEQATTYNGIESGDVQSLVDLIRRNNEIRRTTGLFRTTTSKQMSFALDWVMNNAENAESFLRDIAVAQIRNIAGDYQKISKLEAFKSYRIMGMLSKIATIARNLTSNMVTDPLTTLSRDMVVPIDMLLSKITGTRSVSLDKSWLSSAKRHGSLDGAMQSFIQVGLDADVTDSTSKYEQRTGRVFKMTGSFLERLMSTWAKYEGYALHTTDEFQKGGIRAEERRGIDKLKEKGRVAKDTLLDRPTQEARERTFQADSLAAKAMVGLRDAANKFGITDKAGGTLGLGDIAIPFAGVPANLATQTAKFSPLGLVNGIKDLARVIAQARKGTLNPALQAQAVNNIGKGLTGTIGIAMATVLAIKGIISVAGSDDKNKEALEKGEGKTGTQLNLSALARLVKGESTEWREGDDIVSIGYLEIINSWLITGVMLADELDGDGNISVGDVGEASLTATAQSVLDMPVMQQLNDMVNGFKYSEADSLGGKAVDAATSYAASQASSLVPNFLGGIAQTVDKNAARNPYAADSLGQQALYSVMSKIPGLRDDVPASLDPFGNPRTSDEGVVLNALNANILPGYATSYKPYEISMALDAVTDALKNTDLSTRSVYPERNAPYKFNKNEIDYVLTANERQEYQKLYGQTYNQEVLNLINNKTQYDSKYFKSMTTEEKAEALFDIKSLATDTAKRALVEGKGNMYLNKDEAEKVQSYVSVGLSESKAYSLHNAIQALEPEKGSDSVSTYQKVSTVLKQQMTQGQKVNIVASYFTEHNKDGVVTSESLLPKLSNSNRLISLYTQSKDSRMVSMATPSSFQYEKKTYSLSAADKRLFKETYLKIFNASMSPGITAEEVIKLRDIAYMEAKLAVLDKKLS